ncbi:MAG: chlorite dismutase family protein [Myxococcaceae bacterium]|nr:chlorite dismutase family protein [Myxococcaceae bacterium]
MTRRTLIVGGAASAAACATAPATPEPTRGDLVRASLLGGSSGAWRVTAQRAIIGEGLPAVPFLDRLEGPSFVAQGSAPWRLLGVRSNERYSTRAEHDALASVQAGLGRTEATRACLIPMSKSAAWWALSQDQRRELFETKSQHVGVGARYLPAVARRLYHGRDLGAEFDFLTWFEFAPQDEPRFDSLLAELRATEEWKFVSREVELRLTRA